jgi:cytochrome P450
MVVSSPPPPHVGQRFAMFEEKVLTSTLLRRFQFSYDLDKLGPRKGIADLVLKPMGGMPLQIVPYLQ